jgi:hypothetical protein
MAVFLWLLVTPPAVLLLAVLAQPGLRHRRDTLLATTGRGAIGRVLALGSDDDGMGIRMCWVRVQYDHDGEPVIAKVMVSDRQQQGYRTGQRVGLTYAPSRSQLVRLDPPEWPVPKGS